MIALYNNYLIRKLDLNKKLKLTDMLFKEYCKRNNGYLLVMLKEFKLILNEFITALKPYQDIISDIFVICFNNITASYLTIYSNNIDNIQLKVKSKHNAIIKDIKKSDNALIVCLTITKPCIK